MINYHQQQSISHSGISLVEVRNVHMWCDTTVQCFFDAYHGEYESLNMEHRPMNWDLAVMTPITDVPGTTILFPHLDPDNYYHWLIDTLPCFGVLAMAGIDIHSAEHLYIHRMRNSFQWKMLDLMGVLRDKVIHHDAKASRYFFEHLIIPYFRLDGAGWPHPWLAHYLQERFVPSEHLQLNRSVVKSNRKLYIARGNAQRTVLNEGALIEKLVQKGFEILHPHKVTFPEQAQALSEADFVLASHGAGLANVVFCQPGTKVMEFAGHYITSHFRILCEYSDADYRAIAAGLDESGHRLSVSSADESRKLDFIADIEEIVSRVEIFLAEPILSKADIQRDRRCTAS